MCVHESVHFLCSCPGGRAGTRFSPCWGGQETWEKYMFPTDHEGRNKVLARGPVGAEGLVGPSAGNLFKHEWEFWNRLLPRPASFQHDTAVHTQDSIKCRNDIIFRFLLQLHVAWIETNFWKNNENDKIWRILGNFLKKTKKFPKNEN